MHRDVFVVEESGPGGVEGGGGGAEILGLGGVELAVEGVGGCVVAEFAGEGALFVVDIGGSVCYFGGMEDGDERWCCGGCCFIVGWWWW